MSIASVESTPEHELASLRAERESMKFGVFIYDGVEPIDLATFGVLSMARRIRPDIELCTLAPARGEVRLANGLVVLADHALAEAPGLDVLIVTGGPGWEAESRRPETWSANLEKFPPLMTG